MNLGTVRETLLLIVKVAPFLLIGALAGAALQALLSRRWSIRLFGGQGVRPLLTAIGVAALLPGCSCATMPMAAGIKGTAAPRLGTVTAFIFMSPLLSPITVALTWAMFGWRMTVARIVFSFAGCLLLAFLIDALEPWVSFCGPITAPAPGACAPAREVCETAPISTQFWPSFWTILRSVIPYFLLGMLIAGALSALLPEDAIPRYLGGASGISAYLLAVLVGIPLYVCEGEEVPITYALVARGLGSGPALTFLLGSVGTCVPTILMARGIIGRRATILYTAFWPIFAITSGVLFQVLQSRQIF